MCQVRRLDEFLGRWPLAAFGPAHIVLDDANLDDEDLDYCIALTRTALGLEDTPLGVTVSSPYRDHGRDELEATLAFLVVLRGIPQDDRVEPGDVLCETL